MDACRSRLCMYVSIYLCIYLFVHVSVCMHGCLRAWMHVQMHAGMHVCAQQHVYSKGVQSLDGYTYTFTYMKYVYVYTLYLYIYIYIYGHPPKIYTRLFHTIPLLTSLHWSTTHICRKHRKCRHNRAFRHVISMLSKAKCCRSFG